jgi:hypothetical protein
MENNTILQNTIHRLQNQSIENYKKIQKLQRAISILYSGKQLYVGNKGGLYYMSKKRRVYV